MPNKFLSATPVKGYRVPKLTKNLSIHSFLGLEIVLRHFIIGGNIYT